MPEEKPRNLKRSRLYPSGVILAACGLVLIFWMTVPAVIPFDNARQVGARLAQRVVPGAIGMALIAGGFALMTIGSPGLDAVSWNEGWDTQLSDSVADLDRCRCGAENPSHAKYCNQCGMRLVQGEHSESTAAGNPAPTVASGEARPIPDDSQASPSVAPDAPEQGAPRRENLSDSTAEESLAAGLGVAEVAGRHDE